ncbi:tRNA glutamyl-Q(34) synthetase GluQRS [Granulicoccus phenolivorans]|uniref:tRNA glutamyl-Q(34) synthetase GluQRS n=1 Tax=Granulicoccus phenolivorans TaxID=266854 RepID=UPI00040144F0|nr:tRNA glutamyl-Q(34) synthetase GluQRS [Granulicoccus phenolivorans]
MSAGRFAPSPTSALHVGNLRTALLAWLFARSTGRGFRIRVEDLDRARVAASPASAEQQIADLAALGLDFDPPVVFQSARLAAYQQAAAGLPVYECYCTRREIAESVGAPHTSPTAYPGTCRDLTEAERARRRRERPAALRIRADVTSWTVTDLLHGEVTGEVDDFVIRRNDGAWAYNFVVVVDDLAMAIDQIVRGDDLLSSAPRQAWLTSRLGGTPAAYAHVPLVVNAAGQRLAKRDGAVTLADLAAAGTDAAAVLSLLAASVGLAAPGEPVTPELLLDRFDPARLPRDPWVFG